MTTLARDPDTPPTFDSVRQQIRALARDLAEYRALRKETR